VPATENTRAEKGDQGGRVPGLAERPKASKRTGRRDEETGGALGYKNHVSGRQKQVLDRYAVTIQRHDAEAGGAGATADAKFMPTGLPQRGDRSDAGAKQVTSQIMSGRIATAVTKNRKKATGRSRRFGADRTRFRYMSQSMKDLPTLHRRAMRGEA